MFRRCVMVPISTLAWQQIFQMTKVFLPVGLWASLRHHDLLALLLHGACSRVRQSLHYDLLQEYFSTYFLFPQHIQVVFLFPTPRRLRRTLLVYFCQAAWYIAAAHIIYIRTQTRPAIEFVSGEEGLRPKSCYIVFSFLEYVFTVIRKYVMAPGSSCGAEGDGGTAPLAVTGPTVIQCVVSLLRDRSAVSKSFLVVGPS